MKKVSSIFNRLFTKLLLSYNIFTGGDLSLVDVYIALIIRGRRTLESVPLRIREDVRIELDALGIDGEGNPVK